MTMTIMFTVVQSSSHQGKLSRPLVSWVTELCQMQEGLEVFFFIQSNIPQQNSDEAKLNNFELNICI